MVPFNDHVSAPTTEEVKGALKIARAALEASGALPDTSLFAGMVAALESSALPLAEHRDVLAAAIAVLRVDIEHLHRAASEAERMRLDLMAERDALTAEVARLREVIATKHAIERSSVGVAALVEECETLRVELARRGELLAALAAERERCMQLQGTLDAERRASMERREAAEARFADLDHRYYLAGESVQAHAALVARLQKAATARLYEGHNDTCGARLGAYTCSCGHDELRAAVQEKSS